MMKVSWDTSDEPCRFKKLTSDYKEESCSSEQ